MCDLVPHPHALFILSPCATSPHFSTASSLTALALRLLHLLVENRLADFHALVSSNPYSPYPPLSFLTSPPVSFSWSC
ncbi:hypothetical protein EON64_05335 [archaeon]|nr:MAG: hypothetical protein EON64_05335 [archaeon]